MIATATLFASLCRFKQAPLVFTPPVTAAHALHTKTSQPHKIPAEKGNATTSDTYLEETRHGLISTANLHLEKGSFFAIAAFGRTLHLALLRVIPCARSAKDIFSLLAVEDTTRVEGLGDGVFVGAGAALEAVEAVVHGGHGEDVGAVGTDWIYCVAIRMRSLAGVGWVRKAAYRAACLLDKIDNKQCDST